jgi:hypothetical protein
MFVRGDINILEHGHTQNWLNCTFRADCNCPRQTWSLSQTHAEAPFTAAVEMPICF